MKGEINIGTVRRSIKSLIKLKNQPKLSDNNIKSQMKNELRNDFKVDVNCAKNDDFISYSKINQKDCNIFPHIKSQRILNRAELSKRINQFEKMIKVPKCPLSNSITIKKQNNEISPWLIEDGD